MAADGVFGKVKLEFNSLISFATAPQAFIAVALNPGGNKRLEKEFAFLQPFKTKPNATTPTLHGQKCFFLYFDKYKKAFNYKISFPNVQSLVFADGFSATDDMDFALCGRLNFSNCYSVQTYYDVHTAPGYSINSD